jgi:hypothetical protein
LDARPPAAADVAAFWSAPVGPLLRALNAWPATPVCLVVMSQGSGAKKRDPRKLSPRKAGRAHSLGASRGSAGAFGALRQPAPYVRLR